MPNTKQAEVEAEQPGAAHNESLEEDIDFATYAEGFLNHLLSFSHLHVGDCLAFIAEKLNIEGISPDTVAEESKKKIIDHLCLLLEDDFVFREYDSGERLDFMRRICNYCKKSTAELLRQCGHRICGLCLVKELPSFLCSIDQKKCEEIWRVLPVIPNSYWLLPKEKTVPTTLTATVATLPASPKEDTPTVAKELGIVMRKTVASRREMKALLRRLHTKDVDLSANNGSLYKKLDDHYVKHQSRIYDVVEVYEELNPTGHPGCVQCSKKSQWCIGACKDFVCSQCFDFKKGEVICPKDGSIGEEVWSIAE